MTRKTALKCTAVAVMLVASGCGGSPAPTSPTPAPTPTPTPTVTTPSAVSGRWVGNAPEGMVVEVNPRGECPAEFDLELNLTGTGAAVTGTARTLLRRTTPGQMCSDVLGGVFTYTLANGRIDGSTISFEFGTNRNYRLSGTFTGSRMTGTFSIIAFPESGRFAVNKQ